MNKPVKYTLLGLGGLIVLAGAGAAIFAATFDVNRYKPQIEQIVKEKTGRTLKLSGPLSVAFWPSIGAKASGVTLSERGSDREFVALDSAHVAVKLMPALRGEVIVDELHLSGLKALIVKDKHGKHNFDDLLAAEDPKKPAPKAEPKDAKAPVFDISGVSIEKSALTYRDLAKGSETAITDLKLSTGRIAPKSEGKLELSAQVKGKNPDIDAKVQLAGNYKVDLPARAFELAKLDAKISGNAAGLNNLTATARGDVAASPEKSEFRIAGLAVEVKGMQGKEALEAKISAPSLLVTRDTAKGDEISAQFSMKGENRSTEATVKLSGVQGSAKSLVVPKLTADVSMASPDMPMKSVKVPVTGSLKADLEKQTASADLVSKFDESNIQAKLGLAKFTPPSYLFDINIDRLNLDKYFPPKEEPKGAASTGATKPAAGGQKPADSPIDLSALKELNASGKLQIGALQAQNVKLANLRADIKAGGGRLDVAPHSANLYDGSISGALSATADNRIAIKETLTNISIGPLLRDAAKQDRLEGRGNVSLDVTTGGKTVEAMKKALAGNAKVVLRDGAIKGIDIAGALRKAKSVLPGGQSPSQAANTQEKTDFSEMTASFVIKNGVAHNEDLDMKAPIIRLTGRGDINIGESKLDYQAKAAVVNTTKGQGGADLAELSGLSVPVHLTGPFDNLAYKVDYGAVAADLARSRVGNRIKEQLGERLGIGGAKPAAPASGDAAAKPPAQSGGSTADKIRGLLGR